MSQNTFAIISSLIRLPNILLSILAGFIFCFFYLNVQMTDINFILSITIVILSIATGNMINDYFDYVADKEKKVYKAIVMGDINRDLVFKLYIILNFILLLLSFFFLPVYSSVCLVVNIVLLFLYSYKLKATMLIGNICVAYLSASIFIYLGLVYHKSEISFFPSFFAFSMHLIREIIKDLEDFNADYMNNVKTLAVIKGVIFTKRIVQFVIFVTIVLFSIIIFLIITESLIKYIFIVLIIIPLIFIIFRLNLKLIEKDFNKISQLIKILMIIGLIILIGTVNDFTKFNLFK